MDLLKTSVNTEPNSVANSFNSLFEISSGPVTLLASRFFSNFTTPLLVGMELIVYPTCDYKFSYLRSEATISKQGNALPSIFISLS